ncbi:DUF2933 domain-containing protein [Brevibacillus centrosporus]|uniref:DUF2933 domain-containing protein n=1 Tax=Brevibacillus centrosporus TaxID=54910 RepID=UPI001144FAC4|nr:DUF2933 domain-containing protein [Brevibacillus centrosporus]MEC2133350.1 DUF2933 domain-containing protein [Brevibacillus centrosporus]GED34521.1 hypothetical protein BCE02nite_56620 [Brevibacillus centrosporus]
MTWLQIVALLACPLMMLFCMRGMFAKRSCHSSKTHGKQGFDPEDIQQLKQKIEKLSDENRILMNEIKSIKND